MRFLSVAVAAFLIALTVPTRSSAAPILVVTPTSIALSPAQTVITLEIDPNATPLAAVSLNLAGLASGLTIVAITTVDPAIAVAGPVLLGGDWTANFSGTFDTDRTIPFALGSVTVAGLTPGTPLVLTGSVVDSGFNDILLGPVNVAVVIPEPQTASLLVLGLALLGARRAAPARTRPGAVDPRRAAAQPLGVTRLRQARVPVERRRARRAHAAVAASPSPRSVAVCGSGTVAIRRIPIVSSTA